MNEISNRVEDTLRRLETRPVPVAQGDIFAVTIRGKQDNRHYLLASFHGDTNGLATIPVVRAVNDVFRTMPYADTTMVFGLDANTYEHAKPGKQQDVTEFARFYGTLGLTSVWGDYPNPSEYTTFNARTFLQPQLNKASRRDEIRLKGDVNPKDFILFRKNEFVVFDRHKDNTGHRTYEENTVFPTPSFPSDHGVLSARLQFLSKKQ